MDSRPDSASTLSRRRFIQTAAVVGAGASASLAAPATGIASRAHHDDARAIEPPQPIPGGIDIGGGQLIHTWTPGDPGVTLPFSRAPLGGFDVEPSTMTDFRGFSAVAYHAGTARGSDGATYDVETDMRVFQGDYVDGTGTRRFGTFAFI
jgi:hypothetical protein